MATRNFFELLGDEEADASAVIERAAAAAGSVAPKKQQRDQQQTAKLPSKPLPPVEAVREAFSYEGGARGRGAGRDRGSRGNAQGGYVDRGRSQDMGTPYGRGYHRDPNTQDQGYNYEGDRFQRGRGRGYHGDPSNQAQGYYYESDRFQRGRGRRGGYIPYEGVGRGAASEERQLSDTGRGHGRGRGRGRTYGQSFEGFQPDYGVPLPGSDDQVFEQSGNHLNWSLETDQGSSKQVHEEKNSPEGPSNQNEEVVKAEMETSDEKKIEEETKEISLNDYYKALEERRKHLPLTKMEARKVVVDRDFEGMTLVERKGGLFGMLELEKDKGKNKEYPKSEERTEKSVSIQELLNVEYPDRRGRGRGRGQGRGPIDGRIGSYDSARREDLPPCIEDPSQFPTLGAKQ